MMFGNRWDIILKLQLEGLMHIGSGISKRDSALLSEEDLRQGQQPPEVSLVQRDKDGRAIIPATSLKGALRAQAPLTNSERDALLGEPGEAEAGKGRIARLWLYSAVAEDGAGDWTDERFQGMTKTGGLRRQGFVKTGVCIDQTSGTAKERLLFNREVIGEGIIFIAKATLFLDDGNKDVLRGQLARLLAPLASHPGLLIGGQHRQAGGRLRLSEILIDPRSIDPRTLDLVSHPEPDLAHRVYREAAATGPRAEHAAFRLLLTCNGPYISVRDKTKEVAGKSEVTCPLGICERQSDGTTKLSSPLLWPSSLLGALRARAAWLAEVERLRGYPKGHDFAPSRDVDETLDNRNVVVPRDKQVDQLSSIERLFGVAGWRGLISIASLEACKEGVMATLPMTSVTIDRFTGGGMDQRLFTEETFLTSRFDCELRLEQRARNLIASQQREADRALFDLLLTDICRKGLELGHGAAKGFGWFEVEVLDAKGGSRDDNH